MTAHNIGASALTSRGGNGERLMTSFIGVLRPSAYQRLKDAVAPIAASGKVTLADTDRFARAMYDMRFLFDKETEACVDQIYRAMLDKLTIDTQLERTRARNKEKALLKSSELFKRITDGVFTEVPERMEKFMRFHS